MWGRSVRLGVEGVLVIPKVWLREIPFCGYYSIRIHYVFFIAQEKLGIESHKIFANF